MRDRESDKATLATIDHFVRFALDRDNSDCESGKPTPESRQQRSRCSVDRKPLQVMDLPSLSDTMSQTPTILVVDDDARIRNLLRQCFELEAFAVIEAASSQELFDSLEASSIDLITMDIALGSENGLDLVREIRRRSDIPVIMVTARSELIDTVVGLELGADDYITKPFEMREVIARTRSVLRRFQRTQREDTPTAPLAVTQRYHFGGFELIPSARQLLDSQGATVYLTTSEYDLLEIFVQHAHQVLSRDQLMEQLTGRDWNPSDRLVDNHVAQLRKKMDQSAQEELIKTVRGVGYRVEG